MSVMHDLIFFLLVCGAGFYVIAPAVIRLTSKFRAYAKFTPIESEEIPPKVQSYFELVSKTLVAEGFVHVANGKNVGAVHLAKVYISWWENRSRGQSASCITIVNALGASISY